MHEPSIPEPSLSFGKELQTEREARNISLESVAEGTRFSVKHLRALESGDYSQLPGGVFNKGIVRSYCRHLGLDETAWLDRFTHLHGSMAEGSPDWAEFAENVKRTRVTTNPRMRWRWGLVLLMFLTLAALGYATWRYLVKPRLHIATPTPTQASTTP